jgi:hypothetical protein
VWLIYQADAEWNYRRICSNAGYINKTDNDRGERSTRYPQVVYSEIDIEMIKTSQYYPASSYRDSSHVPKDSPLENDSIIVGLTNWDMACRNPPRFSVGATPFEHQGNTYMLHRWDDWYKALTIRHPEKDDELFKSDYYFYEIEWKPDEIK